MAPANTDVLVVSIHMFHTGWLAAALVEGGLGGDGFGLEMLKRTLSLEDTEPGRISAANR